jgi:hypothetical protein
LEDDTCEECENACDDLKAAPVKDYISCVYDECCFNKCNADEACLLKCCQSKCKRLYSGDAVKYNKCIKEECPDPPDDHPCVGDCSDDYIFRSVSLYNPFPDRGTDVGIIGKNWYNKERVITEANDARSVYFDNTSGFDERYEYGIKINSKQLKKVKEMVKKEKQTINDVSYWGSTSYKFFNKSTSFTSPVSRYAYCSKFLYEDLTNIGIDVTTSEAQLYCRRQA